MRAQCPTSLELTSVWHNEAFTGSKNLRTENTLASIVIPAHNEERGIVRLLEQIIVPARPADLEVYVICNGCTDNTADLARSFGDAVQVRETAEASKAKSLKLADRVAQSFPRVYIDADVEIGMPDLVLLFRALERPGTLATAPTRILDRSGVSIFSGWYYDIWQRLPQVRDGLFGRGVVAVSEEGFQRILNLPPVMSDDLAFSEAFAPEERPITQAAQVLVFPARTWRSLVQRRVRVTIGTRRLQDTGLAGPSVDTRIADLVSIGRADPIQIPKIVIFLGTALCVRTLARFRSKQSQDVWARDETSRHN